MKRNLVAHCKSGTSDKVYMVCIRENDDGSFSVLGKRGRAGKSIQFQLKGNFRTLNEAAQLQVSIFGEKLKKGYVDITSPAYRGGITLNTSQVKDNLEPESKLESVKDDVREEVAKVKQHRAPEQGYDQKEFTVVCVDNTGIEDRFDAGIEYMAEKSSDPKMVNVYDKFGNRGEFLRERFSLATSEAAGGVKFHQIQAGDTIRIIPPTKGRLIPAWSGRHSVP